MNDRVQVLFAFLLLVVLAPLILEIAFFLPVFSGFPIFFEDNVLVGEKRDLVAHEKIILPMQIVFL